MLARELEGALVPKAVMAAQKKGTATGGLAELHRDLAKMGYPLVDLRPEHPDQNRKNAGERCPGGVWKGRAVQNLGNTNPGGKQAGMTVGRAAELLADCKALLTSLSRGIGSGTRKQKGGGFTRIRNAAAGELALFHAHSASLVDKKSKFVYANRATLYSVNFLFRAFYDC